MVLPPLSHEGDEEDIREPESVRRGEGESRRRKKGKDEIARGRKGALERNTDHHQNKVR